MLVQWSPCRETTIAQGHLSYVATFVMQQIRISHYNLTGGHSSCKATRQEDVAV
jgi:hypothetical protein